MNEPELSTDECINICKEAERICVLFPGTVLKYVGNGRASVYVKPPRGHKPSYNANIRYVPVRTVEELRLEIRDLYMVFYPHG